MATYQHIQELLGFHGLDLRSSDLNRPRGFASDGSKNWQGSAQSGIKHRFGSKIISKDFGKTGIYRFDTTDMLGTSKTEIVFFGSDTITNSVIPYVLTRRSFTLTNSHASVAATVSHYYDEATSQFRFKIVRGTTLIDQALGLGTEGSPYMLSSLETAVDALTSFAMSTPTGASSAPAAFMEIIADTSVAAAGGTLTVYYWAFTAVAAPGGTSNVYATLKNAMLEVGSESMRNISAVSLRNCLFMSPGVTIPGSVAGGAVVSTAVLTKYDGQDFYRAGFDNGHVKSINPGTNLSSVGSKTDAKGTRSVSEVFDGIYTYAVSIVRIDKAGNRIESNLDRGSAGSSATLQVLAVSMTSISAFTGTTQGYGYRSAQTNGAQTGVLTITVDSGHTMTAGCIAFFWDENQFNYIQREVTSVTATTIVLSTNSLDTDQNSPTFDAGGNVSVLDNAKITNNFRLAIYRSKRGAPDGALYLQEERPLGYTTEYAETQDSGLGAQYVEPDFPRDPPPQGRYLATFNDQLIVTGYDKRANTVFFSDEGPEYFPKDSHEFDLKAKASGAHQSGAVLVCGTRNGLEVVSGDLLNFAFRVESVGHNIGVASHLSMQELMEGVLAFASYKGPYVLYNGRDLKPLGDMKLPDGSIASRLEPYFTRLYGPTEEKPVFERAIATVLPNDNLYVLFVPHENPSQPAFATSNSLVFAFDYARDQWYEWTGLNMAGGIAVLDDELIFTSRAYDGAGGPTYSDIVCRTSKQLKRKGKYNYADHDQPISFAHKAHWEALGRPGLFKRFLRLKIYSQETRDASTCPLQIDTYVDYDTSKLSFTNLVDLGSLKSITTKIKSEVCRSVQVCLSQDGEYYQPVYISGYELEAVANFRPEFKE